MEKKKPIVVTGSCGRIGIHIVKRLAKKYPIVGFELLKSFYAAAQEELVPVDLSSDESVKQAFTHIRNFYGNTIASVIHLAAYYSFKEKHSEKYDAITVRGTERLLKALSEFHVEQFIFTSTMLVHQPTCPGVPISEESPIAPSWDYPLSKVKTEKIIHDLRGSIPAVIFRIAGVYDDRCHSIPISHQIQRIYERSLESHLFSGDITHGASFVHMEDVMDAIELAVEKRTMLPAELPLLIGEPKTLSYDTMQQIIASELGHNTFKTWRVPKPLAKIGAWLQCHLPFGPDPFIRPWMIDIADDHYELDITQAKKILGWQPKRALEQGLRVMVAELKQDPARWYKDNGLGKPPPS